MARRGTQEGTIRRRADGRWEARVHIGYANGRRQRRSFYGATRREVQERMTAAMRDVHNGRSLPSELLTIEQFLVRWLEDIRPTVRPTTWPSYESNCRLHVIPLIGHRRLAKLTPQDVQMVMTHGLNRGLSPRTVQYIHAILRRALGQAERWDLVSRNVARLVDSPRVRRQEVRPLGPDEARSFLSAIRGHRLEALFVTAMSTGLRQGEALGLRWADFDLPSGVVTVRHTLTPLPRDQRADGGRRGSRLVLTQPKTARSRRSVVLSATALQALREHRLRQLQDRVLAGSRWDDRDFIFTSTIGTPLEARNVTRELQRILALAGLPRLRFHDLRHTAATLLLAQGVHPRVVMETLGHSTIAMTMNVYSHVIPELQRDAARKMDAVLAG